MATLELIEQLRQVPLFSELSSANLERVAAIAQQHLFPRRSQLSRAGQPGKAFYYLLAGEAIIHAATRGGRLRPVAYLRAGDYFGVTSLLLGEPHDTTVEATTDVLALVLQRDAFNALRQEFPDLNDELLLSEQVATKLSHPSLPWLDAGEVVVYYGRRHWFALARNIFLPVLGLLAIWAGVLVSVYIRQEVSTAILIIASLLSLPLLGLTIWRAIDWQNDYLVVTTHRVVRRELILWTYESRQEAPLNRVQDVNIKTNFWGNLLGFGQISIQTAAKSGIGRIVFDYLPEPSAAKNAIFQQIYRHQARSKAAAGESVRRELKRRLGWATAEELEAHPPAPAAPSAHQTRGSWRAFLSSLNPLPPLRVVDGNRITWRKHRLFLFLRIWKPLLLSFVWGLVAAAYLSGRGPFQPRYNPVVGLFLVLSALPLGAWLWWQIADYENDIYILTEDRIIDIEKKPLFFAEERREATLDRVQNVNLIIPNPLAALLGFGNVDIETAGGEGKFTFTDIPAPHEVQREIMKRVERMRERQEQLESQKRRREVADWFAVYEGLRKAKYEAPPPPPAGAPPEEDEEDHEEE